MVNVRNAQKGLTFQVVSLAAKWPTKIVFPYSIVGTIIYKINSWPIEYKKLLFIWFVELRPFMAT
jgi:hypothetical protein